MSSGIDQPTFPAQSALLLVTTRPCLEIAPGLFDSERVLDQRACEELNVTEWCLPAFSLRVRTQALPELQAWFSQRDCTQACSRLPDLVVVVSPGSLALLRAHLPDPWPDNLQLGLMGDGSAAKARGLGIPADALVYPRQSLGQGQDSAGLLAVLRQQPDDGLQRGRILLLQGDRGNQDLAPALQACSQRMTAVHAYHRDTQVISAAQIERLLAHGMTGPVWFYLTSSEAAAVLAPAVLACPQAAVRVLVTHPRIEQAARQAGLPNVETLAPGAAVLRARIAQSGR